MRGRDRFRFTIMVRLRNFWVADYFFDFGLWISGGFGWINYYVFLGLVVIVYMFVFTNRGFWYFGLWVSR